MTTAFEVKRLRRQRLHSQLLVPPALEPPLGTDNIGAGNIGAGNVGAGNVGAGNGGAGKHGAGKHGAGEDGAGDRGAARSAAEEPASDAVVAVLDRMLAVQAQDFGQGVWAVGLRANRILEGRRAAATVHGGVRARRPASPVRIGDVGRALDDGRVIRTWPMRGTLHFGRPDNLRALIDLTDARTLQSMATRLRQLELSDADLHRAAALTEKALEGGRALSRTDYLQALQDGGIATDGQRGSHIILALSQRQLICWGPRHATQQALVLFDEWAPRRDVPERDEALERAILGYLRGHGPATVEDFAGWTKLTIADARRAADIAQGQLESVNLDGKIYLSVTQADRSNASASGGVRMLAGFDEWILGYRDRTAALPRELEPLVVPGLNGIFLPTVIDDGRVVAVWRRRKRAKLCEIDLELFPRTSEALSGRVERAAQEFGAFAGLEITVTATGGRA